MRHPLHCSLPLFLCLISYVAQGQSQMAFEELRKIQRPHNGPWQVNDKQNVLKSIWDKELQFIPAGQAGQPNEIIIMTVPEEDLKLFKGKYDHMAFMYTNVYFFYVLGRHHIGFDTIQVFVFSNKDTVKPVYSGHVNVKEYPKYPPTPYDLAKSLMFLSPWADTIDRSGHSLLEKFTFKGEFDSINLHVWEQFGKAMAGITGKHFYKKDKSLKTISIQVTDDNKQTRTWTFYPQTRLFRQQFPFV